MKTKFFFIMISVLLMPASSATDFSGYGVGEGDFMQYRITSNLREYRINGSLVESSIERPIHGMNLTQDDAYSITITAMENISTSHFGDITYAVYGEVTFNNQVIAKDEVFEVHDIDWERFKAETERKRQQLEAVIYQYDVQVIVTEDTENIGRLISYNENFSNSNSITTANFFHDITYDKATGTVLTSNSTVTIISYNQDDSIDTIVSMSGYERVAFEGADEGFKIPFPGMEVIIPSLFVLIMLQRRWQKR